MTLAPGLEAAFGDTVIEADTAAALGSGEVPGLTTPRVLALAEQPGRDGDQQERPYELGSPALRRAVGTGVASTSAGYNHATPYQISLVSAGLLRMPSYMAKVL